MKKIVLKYVFIMIAIIGFKRVMQILKVQKALLFTSNFQKLSEIFKHYTNLTIKQQGY